MGFVGFRNEDDAANAIKLLHNTFVDTSKIHVEVAKAVCYNFYLLVFIILQNREYTFIITIFRNLK